MRLSEPAPAKLNLALHVRGKRDDGRHDLETLFAFCVDGDVIHVEPADDLSLAVEGPFAPDLGGEEDNLVLRAARALRERAAVEAGARLTLVKKLPVASGLGGGSADAAATLRLLTRLWTVDPDDASSIAPSLGSDVPACLLSLPCRGTGAGDELEFVPDFELSGAPVLLVNPGQALSTPDVFAAWDGVDRGPLDDWWTGRNDLEAPALALVPEIGAVLDWLRELEGATFVRMSGSGASCFALFASKEHRDRAAEQVPAQWWRLATWLR